MKYFGNSGQYQQAANLLEKLAVNLKEPEVSSLLAKSYIGMSEFSISDVDVIILQIPICRRGKIAGVEGEDKAPMPPVKYTRSLAPKAPAPVVRFRLAPSKSPVPNSVKTSILICSAAAIATRTFGTCHSNSTNCTCRCPFK
jgi:hypothetical protein